MNAPGDGEQSTELTAELRPLLPDDADPLHVRFANYWLNSRRDDIVPCYRDLDPVDFAWALASVFVVERRPSDGLFVYRLAGDELCSRLGPSLRGKTAFDVFEKEYAAWTQQRWQRSIDQVAACYVDTTHETMDGRPVTARRMLFPLRGRSGDIDTLIGVGVFTDRCPDLNRAPEREHQRLANWVPVSQFNS